MRRLQAGKRNCGAEVDADSIMQYLRVNTNPGTPVSLNTGAIAVMVETEIVP